MSELGQVLQRAREEKGITLDDIQKVTKIQRRYLEAIERGHFHVLPGHFYARAFIKSYAEAVGLDPNHILSQYQSDLPAQPPQEQVERLRRRRVSAAKTPLPAGRWVTQLLLTLFVLLVIGMIYVAFVSRDDLGTQTIPGSSVTQPNNVTTPQVNPAVTPPPAAGSGNQAPSSPAAPAQTPESPSADQKPTVKFVAQQGAIYKYSMSQGDKLVVKIKAVNGNCWVQVREKRNTKKEIGHAMLKNGDEKVFEAPKTAYVVVGNPPAVEVSVNDAPINMNDVKFQPSFLDISIQPEQP